jgi:phosphoglucomutase/phosphomannomutase
MSLLDELTVEFQKLKADEALKAGALATIEEWLEADDLAAYRPYIHHLIQKGDAAALLDAFWRMMPFGTGGRRGPVGAGPNRINPRTIALSVQGHCDYLRNVMALKGDMSVVVAYDVREFFDMRGVYEGVDGILKNLTSRDMAKASAMTYAANGVTAYVVGPLEDEPNAPICKDRYISTPELSYLIRRLEAAGGLNISASHNHPDDNGGKFYNSDGGQEIPPNDEHLLKEVEKVTTVKTMPYAEARERNLIRIVPPDLHEQYIDMNKALSPASS